MNLSLSEKATVNFYEWEYRSRGYYLFDAPIDIEAPYVPFKPLNFNKNNVIDDGKSPSLLKRIGALLSPPKGESTAAVEELKDLEPNYLSATAVPTLVGFKLSFPKREEINPFRNVEFLNMLSFTSHPISFEILGTREKIVIQIVCSNEDTFRVKSQIKAYFPNIVLKPIKPLDLGFNKNKTIAIADFGISDEFVRPIHITQSFSIDPLTSIIATLENLNPNQRVLFQVIFKGITSPLANDIPRAVSDGRGGNFFTDAPEMLTCAKSKIEAPLFSVVMRIASQGNTDRNSKYLSQELTKNISSISSSEFNKLIPLYNEGYDYGFHSLNLHYRLSNRLGFILNSKELNTFVHYPNNTITSKALGLNEGKTKRLQIEDTQGISLGHNLHNEVNVPVLLNTTKRLSHTHIIGATGTGKSTLLAQMVLQDISGGLGCALFDPHGDIVDDILLRIPEYRKDDVILIDPFNTDFPIGFNLLEAHSEAEKIVLSSDLVSAFKRYATAWGDNMTSVLQNAINTILDSTHGGTLIELKRFLIEEKFRNNFLNTVEDPSLHYYWKQEYPMVRKRIAPLLTRVDTFLRPKIIRYMLAQKLGIDFKACMENNKILLIKLSQGLIGEENSYLLGSLFLAKFNQVAMSRQATSKENRKPYFLYLDEFQNFITPSIKNILSGARKYGLGLTLAHQELSQIEDSKLFNSVITNPYTRICFRLGDNDAKKLETGFSYFESADLVSLSRGEAIAKIGNSSNDFNLKTKPLEQIIDSSVAEHIKQSTQAKYTTPKKDIEKLLSDMLPSIESFKERKKKNTTSKKAKEPIEEAFQENIEKNESIISKETKEKLIKEELDSIELRSHTYLQSIIKKLGQDRNFIATTEYQTKDGGKIDIVLERDALKIGFEISETNKPTYEVNNIKKCLKAGCIPVIMVSKNKNHLNKIEQLAIMKLSEKDLMLVQFIQPQDISSILDKLMIEPQQDEEVIKGFRIVTEYDNKENTQIRNIKSHLARLFKRKK